jgi:hypothetical protein
MVGSGRNIVSRGRATALPTIVMLALVSPCMANASENVMLKAQFSPDRLGVSTTIRLEFNISSTTSDVPSPVTDVHIDLPAGMGLGTTNLGEETCATAVLSSLESDGCSPNSRMGFGSATVAIPVEHQAVKLSAGVTVYMGVPQQHHTTMILDAETRTPVMGQFLFPTELLPSKRAGGYGAELHTAMPLIPTWPEGPPASVVHLETTLGPSHLTYYMRKHGKIVPYTPEGMAVPERCPRGGFRFRADYRFEDGSIASATTSVPCPRASSHRR